MPIEVPVNTIPPRMRQELLALQKEVRDDLFFENANPMEVLLCLWIAFGQERCGRILSGKE